MSETKRPESFRITRVYTKTGDTGETGLATGTRVPKDHLRIEAYGTVDELSAALGVARLELDAEKERFANAQKASLLADHLQYIQNQLFTLGGDLATPVAERHPMMPVMRDKDIASMERFCDTFNEDLEPLRDFILPGGTRTSAALHVVRTVCRRAERVLTALSREEEVSPLCLQYLNRLSDALFVLGRWANWAMGVEEYIWNRELPEPG